MKEQIMVRTCAVSGGVLAMATLAAAGVPDVDVIFSRAATSPTATVPGALDAGGNPVSTQWATMLEFWLSPDGTKWMVRGTTTQPSTESSIMVAGSGLTGTMLVQEAQPFPGAVGGEVLDFISSTTNPFNDNNDMLVALRARGGVSSVFHKLVRFTSMGSGVAYQMGDLYTGMEDLPPAPSGDETIGNSPQSGVLLNDGTVGWRDDSVQNLHSTRRPVTAFNAVKHMQEGDFVTAIDGETLVPIQNIGSTGTITVLSASPDGSVIVVRGNITDESGTPQVVIVNGEVIIQAGYQIAGSSITPTDVNATFVAGNGDWYARGLASGNPWATRNGVVIAQVGDDVEGDTWAAATFSSITGNSNGDWAIAGKTTNADTAIDDVIVVNGEVVLREGDPVVFDIDNDGEADDTAFIGRGNNTLASFTANSLALAPDKSVYVLANLRDEFGADLGPTALIRINPVGGCPADFDNNGTVAVPDIFAFLAAWFAQDESADFDGNTMIQVPDIFAFLAAWFAGC
jgi:hypothetical protein